MDGTSIIISKRNGEIDDRYFYFAIYKVTEPLYDNSETGDTINFSAFSDSQSLFYDRALLILRKRNDKYYMEKIKQWDKK